MSDLSIIVLVAIVSLAGCAVMALAVCLVDRNANRHDKRN
jgi:hypothetical protein